MIKYVHFFKCSVENATPVLAPLCRWEPGVIVRRWRVYAMILFQMQTHTQYSGKMHSSQSIWQSRPLTSFSRSLRAWNAHQICSFYLWKGFYGWWHLSDSNAPSCLSDMTPRILTKDSQDYPVVQGVDVIINCSAFSSPPPIISWYVLTDNSERLCVPLYSCDIYIRKSSKVSCICRQLFLTFTDGWKQQCWVTPLIWQVSALWNKIIPLMTW